MWKCQNPTFLRVGSTEYPQRKDFLETGRISLRRLETELGQRSTEKNQIKSVWKWTKQCFCTDVIPLVLNIENIVHVDFTISTSNHTVPMHILFYCMNMTSLKLQCVIRLRSAEDPSVVSIPWSKLSGNAEKSDGKWREDGEALKVVKYWKSRVNSIRICEIDFVSVRWRLALRVGCQKEFIFCYFCSCLMTKKVTRFTWQS